MKHKINIEDLQWQLTSHGDFTVERKSLGTNAGSQKLGTSLYKLSPGHKAFPFHCHHANEEAILILSGSGTLRFGDEQVSVSMNDYIALPCGSDFAHQLINTSSNELIYLCISTMVVPEVMDYPDSNKVGVMTGRAPGEAEAGQSYKGFFRKGDEVSYYDNE